MVKYNYTGAAELFKRYLDLISDMSLTSAEIQPERRYFMRSLTRRQGIKQYIDYLYELMDNARPVDNAKSKCYDFEYEREIEQLITDIKLFNGVII